MIIAKGRKQRNLSFNIGLEVVEIVDEYKYLGLYFTRTVLVPISFFPREAPVECTCTCMIPKNRIQCLQSGLQKTPQSSPFKFLFHFFRGRAPIRLFRRSPPPYSHQQEGSPSVTLSLVCVPLPSRRFDTLLYYD